MPIYEYKCSNCGRFEQKQSIKDDPLTNCPACDGPVQRLISKTVGIIFKGSGFYITDTKSDTKSDTKNDSNQPSETPAS